MPTVEKTLPVISQKPVQVVATAAFSEHYNILEAQLYVQIARKILKKYPYDMLIFEMADESHFQVKLAGYHLKEGDLVEGKIVYKAESLQIKTFWVKVDDYEDQYVITFLFPEDYALYTKDLEFVDVRKRAKEVLGKLKGESWMTKSNKALGGKTPLEVKPEEAIAVLNRMEYGIIQ